MCTFGFRSIGRNCFVALLSWISHLSPPLEVQAYQPTLLTESPDRSNRSKALEIGDEVGCIGNPNFRYASDLVDAALSSSGSLIACCYSDSNIFVWNSLSGDRRHLCSVPNSTCLRITEDEKSIGIATLDGALTIRSLSDGSVSSTINVGKIADDTFGKLVDGSPNRVLRMWFRNHDRQLVTFVINGLLLWDISSGTVVSSLSTSGPTDYCPMSDTVVTLNSDGPIATKRLSQNNAPLIHIERSSKGRVTALSISPDGNHFAIAEQVRGGRTGDVLDARRDEPLISVYETKLGTRLEHYWIAKSTGLDGVPHVDSIAMGQNGWLFLGKGRDLLVRKLADREYERRLPFLFQTSAMLRTSTSGESLLLGRIGKRVAVLSLIDDIRIPNDIYEPMRAIGVVGTRDSHRELAIQHSAFLAFYPLHDLTQRPRRSIPFGDYPSRGVWLRGSTLLEAQTNEVRIVNVERRESSSIAIPNGDSITCCALSRDGEIVVVAYDSAIRIYRAFDGTQLAERLLRVDGAFDPGIRVDDLAISDKGDLVVAHLFGSESKYEELVTWNWRTGWQGVLPLHKNHLGCGNLFFADKDRLIVGQCGTPNDDGKRSLLMWEVFTHTFMTETRLPSAPVGARYHLGSFAKATDEIVVICTSRNGAQIHFLNVATKTCRPVNPDAPSKPIFGAAVCGDYCSHRLEDGRLRIFALPKQSPQEPRKLSIDKSSRIPIRSIMSGGEEMLGAFAAIRNDSQQFVLDVTSRLNDEAKVMNIAQDILDDLDADDVDVRNEATSRLRELGSRVEASARWHLTQGDISNEVRARLEELLRGITSTNLMSQTDVHFVRLLWAIDQIDDVTARRIMVEIERNTSLPQLLREFAGRRY